MLRSMTGFGQADATVDNYRIQVDMKAVNHRYSEIIMRMPKEWLYFEDQLRKTIQQEIKRGRVEVFITIEPINDEATSVEIDWALAERYVQAAEQLAQRFSLDHSFNAWNLLDIPELFKVKSKLETEQERLSESLDMCVRLAVTQLVEMRKSEGAFLHRDLMERVAYFKQLHEMAIQTAPTVVAKYHEKLTQRVNELMNNSDIVDPVRLASEVAIFADRSNIDEELTRLESHMSQFNQLLHVGEPVGRKLDFLIQEMNREVNTVGSKVNDADLTANVVEMKAELEKMREQTQNVE